MFLSNMNFSTSAIQIATNCVDGLFIRLPYERCKNAEVSLLVFEKIWSKLTQQWVAVFLTTPLVILLALTGKNFRSLQVGARQKINRPFKCRQSPCTGSWDKREAKTRNEKTFTAYMQQFSSNVFTISMKKCNVLCLWNGWATLCG
jgi:uncharacterized protein YifE (UPF0438 family)